MFLVMNIVYFIWNLKHMFRSLVLIKIIKHR